MHASLPCNTRIISNAPPQLLSLLALRNAPPPYTLPHTLRRMHVKELAARFERPAPSHQPVSHSSPIRHSTGSSVSELCQRLERAVIHEQLHSQTSLAPPPSEHTSDSQSRTHARSAPSLSPPQPSPPQLGDQLHSNSNAVPQLAALEQPLDTPVPRKEALPPAALDDHPRPVVDQLAEQTEERTGERTGESDALGQEQRTSSQFSNAYSSSSQYERTDSYISVSDFAPQTLEDIGIIPDVSEGEIDDIEGIERVEDFDSQQQCQSSSPSSVPSSPNDEHFQRTETLDDIDRSYQTEGAESVHIVEGSYSAQTCAESIQHASSSLQAPRVITELSHNPSRVTYSHYSYSPDTAPLSSFHTSTIPSQAIFSRATTGYTASSENEFNSANNHFAVSSEVDKASPPPQRRPYSLPIPAFPTQTEPPPPPPPPPPPQPQPKPQPQPSLSPPRSVPATLDSSSTPAPTATDWQVGETDLQDRFVSQGSLKRLPKAKVLIARRKGHSVSLDSSGVSNITNETDKPASVSADEIHNRRLVREIDNPGEFFAGQVSMVQRISEKSETPNESFDDDDLPPSPSKKPLGELSSFHRKQLRQHAFRTRYDEYLDAEDLNRSPESDESSRSESELLGEGPTSKTKYRHRMRLFGRKNGGGVAGKLEKDRLRAKRHERRKEDIARRSTMLSGALDRVSMAADPWIDFITDAKTMPVPEKARGSLRRAMRRLFGGKGKQQGLIDK